LVTSLRRDAHQLAWCGRAAAAQMDDGLPARAEPPIGARGRGLRAHDRTAMLPAV